MSTEKKNELQAKSVLYFFLAMLVLAVLAVMGSNVLSTPYKYEYLKLEHGWDVSYRGRGHSNVTLESFDADGIIAGEKVTFKRVMPDIYLFSACLTFKTRMSRVRVYEDGMQIYSYGYDIPDGYFVPKAYHYVPLSSDYAGHTVRIELTAAEDGAFSGLYPVTLGNTEDLMRDYVQSRRLGFLVGVFMFYFGFVMIVLSPFLIFGAAKDRSVLFSSMIAILLGIYVLCYNEGMSYITHNDVLSHLIEYISLYLIPIVVILYILTSGAAKKRVRVLFILLAVDSSMAVLAIALHATRVLMINHMLPLFHVMILSESVYLIWLLAKSDKESRLERRNHVGMSSERVLLVGILLFIFSIFLEVIRYYVLAYISKGQEKSGFDFITIGALAVVLSIMLNYFFHSIDHLTEARTRLKLHGMAFTDALTGIDNRASCDQFMAGLTEENRYAVASIDLDGLKIVNDKQGHSIGDMMIAGFGELMREAFSDCQLVGRMGGDEFLVIKRDATAADITRNVWALERRAEEENRRAEAFQYAFSWGVADSAEGENVQAVYMLADERMYRMKDEHHQKKGITAASDAGTGGAYA
ncbi:MAG: GGDEF domain-containing protein [Lachnospiraceae bacterium]|nr:GGDEF domain-containing protein [Lachnospiraceae bacterium]